MATESTARTRTSPSPQPKPPPRRGKRGLVLLLLAVLALVWFAPAIIANSPLKHTLLGAATKKIRGQIRLGDASLGWLSPIQLRDVALHDAQGEPVLHVPAIRTEKSLLSLVTGFRQLGTIRIDAPKLQLVVRKDGSNLEDLFQAVAQTEPKPPGEPSSSGGIAGAIELTNGELHVVDAATGETWQMNGLFLSLNLPQNGQATAANPLRCKLTGTCSSAQSNGGMDAELVWAAGHSPLGAGKADVKMQAVPLAMLRPILGRLAGEVAVEGLVSCNGRAEWSENGGEQVIELSHFAAERLQVSAPRWLGPDTLRINALQAAGQLRGQGDRVRFDNVRLQSELASLVVNGESPMPSGTAFTELLSRLNGQVQGELDLARLAATLPSTLRIREGTQIASGRLRLDATSQAQPNGRRWTGAVTASELTAINQGRRVVLDQPVEIRLAATESPSGLVMEQLACNSSFLQIDARGAWRQGGAVLRGDLDRLAAELGEFVDLGAQRLAGKLEGQLQWRVADDGPFEASLETNVGQFLWAAGTGQPWQEERLTISGVARGTAHATRDAGGFLRRIDAATLRIASGNDQLDVSLIQPVNAPSTDTPLPLRVQVVGELATWQPRLRPFVNLTGHELAGTLQVASDLNVTPTAIAFGNTNLLLDKFTHRGESRTLQEPRVELKTSGVWDQKTGTLSLKNTTLTSSSLAAATEQFSLRTDGGLQASGQIGFRTDLARLMAWTYDPKSPPDTHYFGQASGQVNLTVQGDVTQAGLNLSCEDFVYATRAAPADPANPWVATWREPKVTVAAQAKFDSRQNTLEIVRGELASEVLSLLIEGSLQDPSGRCISDLRGQCTYDLQRVTDRLSRQPVAVVRIDGRETRAFMLRGPLFPPAGNGVQIIPASTGTSPSGLVSAELLGEASLGWTSINVAGIPIGKGELKANLLQGVVKIDPVELAVGDGKLRLAPRAELQSTPATLLHERARVAENVRITPEMCQLWLKYVAPLMADATRAEGRFSLDLSGLQMPLTAPAKCSVAGTLAVHSAEIGPGPLATEIVLLAEQVRSLIERRPLAQSLSGSGDEYRLKLPEQSLDFQVQDGRVFHRGLQMVVKDVVVRTQGSVGFDQSLEMVAEVPIRDEWVSRDRYLSSLKGQTLQIPIGGTVNRPRLDRGTLQQLSGNLVRSAAGKILDTEIQRGLQKLFGPVSPPPQ